MQSLDQVKWALASLVFSLRRDLTSPSVNKNPEKAVSLAKEIGPKANGLSVKDAVGQADIIFLAVKYEDAAEALKAAGDLTNKVVIDISNPITADFKGLTIGHSTSAAEEIQKLVPSAKVVKAFNTIFAELLPTESRKGRKVQVFIAGDDQMARAKVSDLVKAVRVRAGRFRHALQLALSRAYGRDEYFAWLLPGLGNVWRTGIPKELKAFAEASAQNKSPCARGFCQCRRGQRWP